MNSEYKFFKIYEGVWVMVCRLVEHDELKSGSSYSRSSESTEIKFTSITSLEEFRGRMTEALIGRSEVRYPLSQNFFLMSIMDKRAKVVKAGSV